MLVGTLFYHVHNLVLKFLYIVVLSVHLYVLFQCCMPFVNCTRQTFSISFACCNAPKGLAAMTWQTAVALHPLHYLVIRLCPTAARMPCLSASALSWAYDSIEH